MDQPDEDDAAVAAVRCTRAHYRRLRGGTANRGGLRRSAARAKRVMLAARSAYRGWRRYGHAAAQRCGAPAVQQLIQLWRWNLLFGAVADSYYGYELFRSERARLAEAYVQNHEVGWLLRYINGRLPASYLEPFEDKKAFWQFCQSSDLPTIPVLATFRDGGQEGQLPCGADVFVKPTNLNAGQGARRLRWDGTGWAGQSHDAVEQALRAESLAGTPLIAQPVQQNHPDLRLLTTGALCTIRFITACRPGGDPEPAVAVYRMPIGSTAVDNFTRGGMAAPVDLGTGRLGCGVRGDPQHFHRRLCSHPDTRAQIEGTLLPGWRDVVELAIRAHRAAPYMVLVGWDIAISADGPLLVEGNRHPCSRLAQMPSGRPLGATPVVNALNAHLEELKSPSDDNRTRPTAEWRTGSTAGPRIA